MTVVIPLPDLNLKADVLDDVGKTLCRNAEDAVHACRNRDALLAEWDDQEKCRYVPLGRSRYRGACELNDPLTMENVIALRAMLTATQRKDPPCYVEAQLAQNNDNARIQEAWLTWKNAYYKLYGVKEALIHRALVTPCAVLYVGWKQVSGKIERPVWFLDGDGPPIYERADLDPEQTYVERIESRKGVTKEECEFRVTDISNVYPYPPDAPSPEKARGIFERMRFSEEDLLMGVRQYGYDKEAVKTIIQGGPQRRVTDGQDTRMRRNEFWGVRPDDTTDKRDGTYECFLFFGRLPYLRDDDFELRIPEDLLFEDVFAVICPSAKVVLKLEASPYSRRPYFPFYILPENDSFYGRHICDMLEQIQEEATATLRWTIDGYNMESAPVLVVPDGDYHDLDRYQFFPGAVFRESIPGSIRTLPMNRNSLEGLNLLNNLQMRAQGLCAAEGYGNMNPQTKQRHNDEIQNMMQGANAKFDLYLSNYQFRWEDVYAWMVQLHLEHADSGGEEQFQVGSQEFTITAEQLRGDYRYVPTATSQTANPETRLAVHKMAMDVFMQYVGAQNQLPPQYVPNLWQLSRQILMDLPDLRNPEAILGPEPPPTLPPIMAWEQSPQVQAMVAQGVPPQVIAQQLPPPIRPMPTGATGPLQQSGSAVGAQMQAGPQAA